MTSWPMTMNKLNNRTHTRHARLAGATLALAAGLLSSCGGGSPAPFVSTNANVVTAQPDGSIGSQFFIGDTHFSGDASELKLRALYWGRLANVLDSTGSVQMRDFLVSNAIRNGTQFLPSNGVALTYELSRHPITDQFLVTIPAEASSLQFEEALRYLEANLTPVFDRSLDVSESGPFSMMPRNATMVMQFSDLLEPAFQDGAWHDQHGGSVVNAISGQLNSDVIRVRTGYPPESPQETRIFMDPNHGNLLDRDQDGEPEFYPTRVLICPTISPIDAQASNPPLAVNAVGLPASLVTDSANLGLRIPTQVNTGLGQSFVLRNTSGRVLSFDGNGSTSDSNGTPDVVRALRSGGSLTSDPHNGFLIDEIPPRLLADQPVAILGSPVVNDPMLPQRFTLPAIHFDVTACAGLIRVGDVIAQGPVSGLVVDPGTPLVGVNVVVDVVAGELTAGAARLQSPFDPSAGMPACFLRFSPAPSAPPAGGVQPEAALFLRFSEPMDPATLTAYDNFSVHRGDGSGSADRTGFGYAFGRVVPGPDLRTFRWDHPQIPFQHVAGALDTYFISLNSGVGGPTDLAGNPLFFGLPEVPFQLDPNAQESLNDSFALRFANLPDDLFDDGLPELRAGQLLYDPVNERILPRPVNRFSSAADTNQPLPAVMVPFAGGVQTPLSNLGSKLQTLWRYVDVGFSLTDETNYNVDIEGLSWAPDSGNVIADAFEEFSVSLAHSKFLPDEVLFNGLLAFPASGIKQSYAGNYSDSVNDPGTVVHERSRGYIVNPSNLYTATSGTAMLPYPVNENRPLEDQLYYTWRDTALDALGGLGGGGAVLQQEIAIAGVAGPPIYAAGQVPTVGLPLLMEFRCYPSNSALGLNALGVALAANLNVRPNFRAFSTGGFNGTQTVYIDPDNADTAAGGWTPATNTATPGTDNTFYIGEMALVTRVSRVHSIWFDSGSGPTTYAQPIMEPELEQQPAGTSVTLAFRGATSVTGSQLTSDATAFDAYGNSTVAGTTVLFLAGDKTWKNDITQINSARYFQVRITFVSNAATERSAELRTLAFGYFK